MLQPLLDQLSRAAIVSGKGDSLCPRCGSKGRPTGQTFTCPSCDFIGAPAEWYPVSVTDAPRGRVDSPPAGTRIKKKEPGPGATAFEIPASGRSGGLLFFAIFWLAITAPLSFSFLFGKADFSSSDISAQYEWLVGLGITLFFSIFWAIGLGMLYAGLKGKFSKHLLLLKDDTLVHVRELFRKKKSTSFRFSEIRAIAAIEFYQSNYEPVFGVEIRGPNKKIRFGSTLTDEEKGWLVAELTHLVFPSQTPDSPEEGEAPASNSTGPAPKGPFEVVIPKPAIKAGDWVGFSIGLVISVSFVVLGLSPVLADSGFFRIIWTAMSSCFLLIIAGGMAHRLTQKSVSESISYDGVSLNLRKSRHGRVTKEKQLLPLADDLSRVALYPIGTSNGEARYTASLITATEVIPLFRWKPHALAEDFVKELRQHLSLPQESLRE